MKDTLFYLVIYDLPDSKAANKRRNRLHKCYLVTASGRNTVFLNVF